MSGQPLRLSDQATQTREPEPVPPHWDYSQPRTLPDDLIDNGFAGWDGRGRIDWTDRGIALDLEADSATRYYHVFSPDKNCGFFCFEPVTHEVNAFAKPGGPEANDLRVLMPDRIDRVDTARARPSNRP